MDNNRVTHSDPTQPDFPAFAAEVHARVPQHQTLLPDTLEGLARLGRLVQTLRTKQRWSLQILAAQTGLPWLWLALLEQGMLLPAELTPEAVQTLGRVFPTRHSLRGPEVFFHALVEDLLNPQAPPQAVEPSHFRADQATRPTPLRHLGGVIRWLSPLWSPPLAGEVVTAADTPAQEHVFDLPEGSIRVTCAWWAASPGQPAALLMTWHADLTRAGEVWVRFTRRDDAAAVLAEVPLGEALAGEMVWSALELGFDPTREPWALALLIREASR